MSFLHGGGLTLRKRNQFLKKPFEFTLIDSENPDFGKSGPVLFNTFGCPEDEDLAAIKRVGRLAQEKGKGAAFSILLGDNNTQMGVTKFNDPKFKLNFHDVHALPESESKLTQPFLVLLGNHDRPTDEAAIAQIAHTFVDPITGEWDPKKIACWESKEVDLATLRRFKNNWNMPGSYGVYHCGHTDLFAIDSSKFVTDFINYFILKKDVSDNNQAAWLFKTVKESQAVNKVLLSHHPLNDISKRNIVSDHKDYITEEHVLLLKELGITGNYNEILNQIIFLAENPKLGIPAGPGHQLTEVLAAHHHSLNYIKGKKPAETKAISMEPFPTSFETKSLTETTPTSKGLETKLEESVVDIKPELFSPVGTPSSLKKTAPVDESKSPKKTPPLSNRLPQWVSGGAGGPVQARYSFKESEDVLFQSTQHGFVQHHLAANGISSGAVKTVEGLHVQISNGHIVKEPRTLEIARIEKAFIDACTEFKAYLAQQFEKTMLTMQPKYRVVDKLFDWVPHFYRECDEITNFCNHVEPHTQSDLETYLRSSLKLCAIDPAKQLEADTSLLKKAVLKKPSGYLPMLVSHQKKWMELVNNQLFQLYGLDYDSFLESKSPLALLPAGKTFTKDEAHITTALDFSSQIAQALADMDGASTPKPKESDPSFDTVVPPAIFMELPSPAPSTISPPSSDKPKLTRTHSSSDFDQSSSSSSGPHKKSSVRSSSLAAPTGSFTELTLMFRRKSPTAPSLVPIGTVSGTFADKPPSSHISGKSKEETKSAPLPITPGVLKLTRAQSESDLQTTKTAPIKIPKSTGSKLRRGRALSELFPAKHGKACSLETPSLMSKEIVKTCISI